LKELFEGSDQIGEKYPLRAVWRTKENEPGKG
jgi:hypothetical protein